MWKLNEHGQNAVHNAVSRQIKYGMKAETWLEDAEEEANRAWEDPEWTHREAELELLPVYCKDGRIHIVALYPGWFDWISSSSADASSNNRQTSIA